MNVLAANMGDGARVAELLNVSPAAAAAALAPVLEYFGAEVPDYYGTRQVVITFTVLQHEIETR